LKNQSICLNCDILTSALAYPVHVHTHPLKVLIQIHFYNAQICKYTARVDVNFHLKTEKHEKDS